jgi:hypothetical protein
VEVTHFPGVDSGVDFLLSVGIIALMAHVVSDLVSICPVMF